MDIDSATTGCEAEDGDDLSGKCGPRLLQCSYVLQLSFAYHDILQNDTSLKLLRTKSLFCMYGLNLIIMQNSTPGR